jgi:predicted Rossmann fold nucleotide-binding protein DprA/Smf involved in DNA uptake
MKNRHIILAIAALCSLSKISAMYQQEQARKLALLQQSNLEAKQQQIASLEEKKAQLMQDGNRCMALMKNLQQQMQQSRGNTMEEDRIKKDMEYAQQWRISLANQMKEINAQIAKLN